MTDKVKAEHIPPHPPRVPWMSFGYFKALKIVIVVVHTNCLFSVEWVYGCL